MAALRPDWEDRGPLTDTERIDDEINRQVAQCTCRQKFKVFQVGEGKYRVSVTSHHMFRHGVQRGWKSAVNLKGKVTHHVRFFIL